jgi:hypothetical protein
MSYFIWWGWGLPQSNEEMKPMRKFLEFVQFVSLPLLRGDSTPRKMTAHIQNVCSTKCPHTKPLFHKMSP